MKTKSFISILLLSCFISEAQEAPDDQSISGIYYLAKITAKIVDEQGQSIEDANVNLRFTHHERYRDGYNDFHGQTDSDGKFSGESEVTGPILIIAEKQGYYRSELSYQPTDWSKPLENSQKLEPWNPTIPVMLKRIKNPIPMIVRSIGSTTTIRHAPKMKEKIGFDIIKYDWVRPHGVGEHADFDITFKSEFMDPSSYRVTVGIYLNNPDDGLIPITKIIGEESELKYPRVAPQNGYSLQSINLIQSAGDYLIEKPEGADGYFFRIRTEKDPVNKKIISAQYGMITTRDSAGRKHAPFWVVASMYKNENLDEMPGIAFAYRINPTRNDRNLEYDQQTNLAPSLSE